jgi:hypothetical protein
MLYLTTDVNETTVGNKQKNLEKFFCWHLENHCPKEKPEPDPKSSVRIQGSKDPDPYQNVTGSEH